MGLYPDNLNCTALERQLLDLGTPEINSSECHTPYLRSSESADECITQYQAHPTFLPSDILGDSPAAKECILNECEFCIDIHREGHQVKKMKEPFEIPVSKRHPS